MSRHTDQIIRCNAPGCIATCSVRLSGRPIPEGWWFCDTTIRGTHACPTHAPEARRAEKQAQAWAKKRAAAMNAWSKKNPPPELPNWLADVIP